MTQEEKLKMMQEFAKNSVKIGQIIFEVAGDNNYYANEKTEEMKGISEEQMGDALKEVQKYMWGNSASAVIFCTMRDNHGFADNMSQFERMWGRIAETKKLQWLCPEGTIRAAFKNNPYFKLPVSKWQENGVPDRVLFLKDKFEELLEP